MKIADIIIDESGLAVIPVIFGLNTGVDAAGIWSIVAYK